MGRQGQEHTRAEARIESTRAVYSAFNKGDIEAVIALMSPDVDWANAMEGGREHGHNAIRRVWDRLSKQFACKVKPESVETDRRGRVVAEVAIAIRDANRKPLAHMRARHIFTFRGDLIQRLDVHEPAQTRY